MEGTISMEINQYLKNYYENYDEDSRLLSRRGQIEYLTTMGYIQAYLQPGMKILEIGAGTGRYSLALASAGYNVTAVELVGHNLEILKSKITPDMHIRAMEGNALNLSMLDSGSYDMTLLLGPMYHLYNEADKKQALAEAIRVTKPGGIVYVAYCISESNIINYGFQKGHIMELISEGLLDLKTFKTISRPQDLFELVRKSDIDKLMEGFPTHRLHYVATDGLAYIIKDTLDAMDEDTFRIFLTYHLTVCENADLVGATAHSLDVFRKM